jgi:hypothetical protein
LERSLLYIDINLSPNLTQHYKPRDGLKPPMVIF